MSLTVSANGGDFELTPAGVYPAVCVAIADIGEQVNVQYGSKSQRLCLGFEIEVNGAKIIQWQEWTKSLHAKSKLRPMLESWRGKPFTKEEQDEFQLINLLKKACQVQVMHNEKGTWANITNIMPKSEGQSTDTENTAFTFDVEDPKQENFDLLPKYIQNKVTGETNESAAPVEKTDEEVRADVDSMDF